MTDDEASDVWAPPEGPAQDPGPWRIIRARRDRGELDVHDGWLGGVCAGLATSIGADVLLVRLAFLLASAGGFGILAYLGLWLFTPRAGEDGTPDPWPAPKSMAETIKVVLFVSAIVGLLGGVRVAEPLGFDDFGGWIGLALIVGGAVWLIRRHDDRAGGWRSGTEPPAGVAPPPPPPSPGPTGPAGASGTAPPPRATDRAPANAPPAGMSSPVAPTAAPPPGDLDTEDTSDERRSVDDVPDEQADESAPIDATLGLLPPPEGPPGGRAGMTADGGDRVDAGGKWSLAPAVLAWIGVLAAIGLKLAAGALVLFDAVEVPRFAVLVCVSTVGTVVMIFAAGRRRGVSVYGAGASAIVVAAVAGAIWGSFNGPLGTRDHLVREVAELRAGYEVAAGELSVDVADIDLRGREETVDVTMGVGRIDVIVPDDVDVQLVYDAQLAGVQWGTQTREGWEMSGTVELPSVDDSTGTLLVDADLGAGELYVCRAADADRGAGECDAG